MNEEEVWIILHSDPKKIDSDLLFDLSMYGRRRMEQVSRWRKDPGYFLYRDITAMLNENFAEQRRKEVMKKMIEEFKEGTRGRRDSSSEEEN